MAESELKANDIDNILDEVENWDSILSEMKNGNIQHVKNLVSSNDIDINAQNPQNGMTLLMYAVIIGNMDLVKALCNFGADASIKDNDGDDALHYSIKYGRYKITELIYYRTLSGSLGKDLQRVATDIHHKNEEAKYLMQRMKQNEEECGSTKYFVNLMMHTLEERAPFGGDMLYYSWYFIVNDEAYNKETDPLDSDLFKAIMRVYEQILGDTSDKKGWQWLKTYLLPSLIWYLPRLNASQAANIHKNENEMEHILEQTLFYELLHRVRTETKKQSDLLLKERINEIKGKHKEDWNTLVSYSVATKDFDDARQDLCGTLKSQYTEEQLSEDIYPPSTHFSAKKFYDSNIYLNQLLFTANILDSQFQADMKLIAQQVDAHNNDIAVSFRAGPVKTLERSQTKVENDYIQERYPTAAKILDMNRCALQFKSIESMMKFLDVFTQRVKQQNAYSIVDIIRCKNGWNVYNDQYPSYTDLKLNVLVKSGNGDRLVAEIQFLLKLMSGFKKKAHKLYAVERRFEFVYNFGKLMDFMKQFNNIKSIHDVFIDLAQNDNVKQFKFLFSMIKTDEYTLSTITDSPNAALFEMIRKNDKIYKYIHSNYKDLYLKTLERYTNTHGFDAILEYYFVSIVNDEETKAEEDDENEGTVIDDEKLKQFLVKLYDSIKADAEIQIKLITNLCLWISSLLPSQTPNMTQFIDTQYQLHGFIKMVQDLFAMVMDFRLHSQRDDDNQLKANYQGLLMKYVKEDDVRKYKLLCDLQKSPEIAGDSILFSIVNNEAIAHYLSSYHLNLFHAAIKTSIDENGLFDIMLSLQMNDVDMMMSFIDHLFLLTDGNETLQHAIYRNSVTKMGNELQEKKHFIYAVGNCWYEDHKETFTAFEWAVHCGEYEMIKGLCKNLNGMIVKNKIFEAKDIKALWKGACLVNDALVIGSILKLQKTSEEKIALMELCIEERYEKKETDNEYVYKYKKYTPMLYVVKKGYIESAQEMLNNIANDKVLLSKVFSHEIEEWWEETEDCESECGSCLEINKKSKEGNVLVAAQNNENVMKLLQSVKL